ncbi:esterase/lipase family protein [Tomitella biformata]|uniref:esterase/lipase family protein n=1 Tax=Tomitella biformata TaxID=630403 RepID=UPI0004652043|nr:alpha/beta fold hydrolase [Tomitella biformata]
MPNLDLIHMLGDAMAVPVRVATVLQKSVGALDVVAGDAAVDAASLALAATVRAAVVAAGAVGARLPAPRPDLAHVSVSLPHGDAPAAGDSRVPHVSVRASGETTTVAAPAMHQRRVDYDFFSGIAPEIRHPGGALPGANRWDTPLSAERPIPVVLVHGTGGGGQTNWGPYVPLLTNHGFSVFTLTYGAIPGSKWPVSAMGGMRLIEDSAAEFGEFAERVLAATGAAQIDVVGHSQGTIVPNYWAKYLGGQGKIRRYVSLAPLWHGTEAFGAVRGALGSVSMRFGVGGGIASSVSIPQMIAGSAFLAKLNAGGGPYVEGIEYTNISTRHDEFVNPYTNGQVPGGPGMDVTNVVVQDGCPEDHSDHLGICGSERAATMVLNALDDVEQQKVPCGFAPPFFG